MAYSSYSGNPIRFNNKDEFLVPSEDPDKYGVNYTVRTVSYRTQSHDSGVDLDCTCPSYRFNPDENGIPGCKHTARVLREYKPVVKFTGFERVK